MTDIQDRLTALEERIAVLQARVTALEERLPQDASALPSALNLIQTAFLQQRQQQGLRGPQGERAAQGTLTYGGVAQIAGKPYQMQRQQSLASLFETAPETLAQVFAALASPHRIIILRLLCQEQRTSQQLQELLGMSSAGQLYHHLKELLTAGLIVQRERSVYSIDPAKVITICVALMVASNLTFADHAENPRPDPAHPTDQATGGSEARE